MRKKPEYPENFTAAVEANERQERIDLAAALVAGQLAGNIHYGRLMGCALGRVASVAGDVITLDNASHASRFRPGLVVAADESATFDSPRAGTATVIGYDTDAGSVTLSRASLITSLCNWDYLFAVGSPFPEDWARSAYDAAEALEAERTRRLKP